MKRRLVGLLAAVVVIAGSFWLLRIFTAPTPGQLEVRNLLAALEHECDPDSPDNNYEWLVNTSPTEPRRMKILTSLRDLGPTAHDELAGACRNSENSEFKQMLEVAGAALGDEKSVIDAAKRMFWSDFPAVRICASHVLRDLKDRRTDEWFRLALGDDRGVDNSACSTRREWFYPVRVNAQIALLGFGHTEDEIRRWTSEALGEPVSPRFRSSVPAGKSRE